MEKKFEELVYKLNISPLSVDILQQILLILKEQDHECLYSFVHKSYESLLVVERWLWKVLSSDYYGEWINEEYYQEFFYTVASFNKNLILYNDDIELNVKTALLLPVSTDQVSSIFKQINQTDNDNDMFIMIASLWFDNHSCLIHNNPPSDVLPITDHINEYILHNYILSKQYKTYLNELSQSVISQSVFTAKMLFYIRTCSFSIFSYVAVSSHKIPCTADELVGSIRDDYLQIVHIHSRTIRLWSKELLACMTQLIAFGVVLFWPFGPIQAPNKTFFAAEQNIYDHIEDLMRIIDYRPFHKEMKPVRSNDETSIMDATLMILIGIVRSQNVGWFFRSNVSIQNALTTLAEAALYDEICLCVYVILGEVLADEQLKNLKIANSMSGFFFNMLKQAWKHPLKKYRHTEMEHLLQEFFIFSKHDFMQQKTANMNKIPLLIEMSDQYPIVYDIIWGLSFNHDIQQQLHSNPSFIHKLSQLAKESNDEQMRKTTHGILWNLEINHQDRSISQNTNQNTFHIMISYSHKEKVLCKQLYDELTKSGYRVWIDFDQMHGNVMDAMAQAIDQSEIIIICMSEQYRQSNYCRAEAHYAFQRQRQIVPVLMQKHYKPDGWLLFLIGQLLYVDFTKYEFVRAMEMLSKELKAIHVPDTKITPVQPKQDIHVVSHPTVTITSSSNIIEWTSTQVHDWLLDQDLVQMPRLLNHCDGRSLVYLLKYMDVSQPEQVLSLLQEDSLRLINQNISLIELSRFHSMMHQQK
ncbi:unnamed protein product [Adineta steineri]|uniref:TIR domain-containing protein n=3 Tax=Adineta steineri TaxID=433720 RepID=A0A819S842_9BILA|nr:unnamed protein product [Adineta steineri]CAF4060022.1 unnamed protein product [Adineta steineri]